jgi:hypothetical protein
MEPSLPRREASFLRRKLLFRGGKLLLHGRKLLLRGRKLLSTAEGNVSSRLRARACAQASDIRDVLVPLYLHKIAGNDFLS